MRPCEPGSAEGWSVEKSIDSARAGSFSVVGHLLDFYRGYLLAIANGELSPELAQKVAPSDLVQETCYQATRHFAGFEGATDAELKSWLRQILIRIVRDTQRRFQKAEKRDCGREIPLGLHADGSNDELGLVDGDATPSSQVAMKELKQILAVELELLSAEQRTVIQLRSFEGLSFEKVGQEIGKTTEAARKIWVRAIDELADRMVRDESRERQER